VQQCKLSIEIASDYFILFTNCRIWLFSVNMFLKRKAKTIYFITTKWNFLFSFAYIIKNVFRVNLERNKYENLRENTIFAKQYNVSSLYYTTNHTKYRKIAHRNLRNIKYSQFTPFMQCKPECKQHNISFFGQNRKLTKNRPITAKINPMAKIDPLVKTPKATGDIQKSA